MPLRLPCAHVTNLRLRTRAVSDRWYERPVWQTVVLLHTSPLLSCWRPPSCWWVCWISVSQRSTLGVLP